MNEQLQDTEPVKIPMAGNEKIRPEKTDSWWYRFTHDDMLIFNLGIYASMMLSGWSIWTGIDKIYVVDDHNQNAAFLHMDKVVLQVFVVFTVVFVGGSILKNWHKLYYIGERSAEKKFAEKTKNQVKITVLALVAAEFASRVAIFVDFNHQTPQQWISAVAVTLLVLVPAMPGTAMQLLREQNEKERDAKENARYARHVARAAWHVGSEIMVKQLYAINPNDPGAFEQVATLMPGFQSGFRSTIKHIARAEEITIEGEFLEIATDQEQKLLESPKEEIHHPQVEESSTGEQVVVPLKSPRRRAGRQPQNKQKTYVMEEA